MLQLEAAKGPQLMLNALYSRSKRTGDKDQSRKPVQMWVSNQTTPPIPLGQPRNRSNIPNAFQKILRKSPMMCPGLAGAEPWIRRVLVLLVLVAFAPS